MIGAPADGIHGTESAGIDRVGVLIAGGRHQGGRGMTSNQNAKNKKPDAGPGSLWWPRGNLCHTTKKHNKSSDRRKLFFAQR